MSFIVRIYYNDCIYSIDLEKNCPSTIGSDVTDTIPLTPYKLSKHDIRFVETNKGIKIKGKHLYIHRDNRKKRIFSDMLSLGKQYVISSEPEIAISIHPKQSDASDKIDLSNVNVVSVGRSSKNNIIFKDQRTSSEHFKIYKSANRYRIADADSRNGTYVNGERVIDTELKNGDIINFSIYHLKFDNGLISVFNVGNDMTVTLNSGIKIRSEEELLASLQSVPESKGTINVFNTVDIF